MMKGYRVIFENNIPVFARTIDGDEGRELVNLTNYDGKRMLNWLVVYGDNETDALEIAAKVMKTIWSEYLA